MRRLFFAVSATMFVDSLLYLAIVPLLPWYANRFDLSTFEAALLLASYPIAFLITTRRGPTRPASQPAGTVVIRNAIG